MPLLDLAEFYEPVFFSWLVVNKDMHLKNFSLYAPKGKWFLTPAYDLLNVSMANPKDTEELALTLAPGYLTICSKSTENYCRDSTI